MNSPYRFDLFLQTFRSPNVPKERPRPHKSRPGHEPGGGRGEAEKASVFVRIKA